MAKCWENHGHPEMSQCVLARAHASYAALEKFEGELRARLVAILKDSEYPPGYVTRLRKYLDQSDDAYRRYRASACTLQLEFTKLGNGAEDAKNACEAVLDDQRITELREASWWLWK
jgi:hypothetical protein